MTKAYWIISYRSISDPVALAGYARKSAPAVIAGGGRILVRGLPVQVYEAGQPLRTVVIEFDSLAQALSVHEGAAYQAALAVLGQAAVRDFRIVEEA
jgi:uncharacterized protein (DUF1330 family)